MYNRQELDFDSIVRLVNTIREDFDKGVEMQKEIAKRFLPPFNHFVKNSIDNGDFEKFTDINKTDNKPINVNGYIHDLADIFFEPILPINLQEPQKYKILSKYLADFYI